MHALEVNFLFFCISSKLQQAPSVILDKVKSESLSQISYFVGSEKDARSVFIASHLTVIQ